VTQSADPSAQGGPEKQGSGKTALITGAGRNIGADMAHRFAIAGYRVVLAARQHTAIKKVEDGILASGGEALAVTCDVTNESAVMAMTERIRRETGRGVDVLVNNAMVRVQRPLLDMTREEWDTVLGVVLTGAFHTTRAVLPWMRGEGWGRVINISGLAGQSGAAGRAGIVTAKSGLIGFTKAVALEVAAQGITVNSISPGVIGTRRTAEDLAMMGGADLASKHYEEEQKLIPVGRMGCVSEVSATCLFLASEDASFITGQVLSVNGGRYL
jgi:NAD(P)-dependent dehydrogenase (short-subunit alcohol dehydrogenase family)